MKYLSILLLVLAGMQQSIAQNAQHTKHHQLLNLLLQEQAAKKPAMKTTTGISGERVVAQSTKDNTLGSLNDSVNIKYGPNRGSTYDYNDMIYAYNYPYSTSPMFNYAGTFTKPQVLFDTMRHWTVDPNTLVYGFYEMDYAGYDLYQNTKTYKELYLDSAIYPNMNFINKFNSANNIDSAYSFNWIAGVSDSAFKQFFTYNAMNQVTKDSTYEYHLGAWHLVSRSTYTYNLTNDLVQIDNYVNDTDTTFTAPLIEKLQYINTYDATHRLLTVASSYYNGTTFGPYVRDTFAYSGTYTWHNSWKEYQYDPINGYWAPMFNMSKHINLSGQPDTVLIKSFDSLLNAWVPQTMDIIHYNASHDPDTLKDYEYNFTAYPATPNFTTIYYYQAYLNSLETNPVAAVKDEVKIFPNPASDQFTITQLNVTNGAKVYITLMNANGQMVSRESTIWQGSHRVTTGNLIPGVYWVLIQDVNGNLLHRQSIVKQ